MNRSVEGRPAGRPSSFRGSTPAALALLVLAACSSLHQSRVDNAQRIADAAGWSGAAVPTPHFLIQAYHSPKMSGRDILTVYIEGDGPAWPRPDTPPADPTPVRPIALELAVRTPPEQGPAIYLGRPCQYTIEVEPERCDFYYWTIGRYAERAVAALDFAVDHFVSVYGASRVQFVGYSGGGVMAAHLTARRTDVVRLVTVAANLDTEAWIRRFDFTPLADGSNPIHWATRLAETPQVHLVGVDDRQVPLEIVASYGRKVGGKAQDAIVPFDGHDHVCCWAEIWPEVAARYLD